MDGPVRWALWGRLDHPDGRGPRKDQWDRPGLRDPTGSKGASVHRVLRDRGDLPERGETLDLQPLQIHFLSA